LVGVLLLPVSRLFSLPVLPVAFFIYAFPHPVCARSRFSLSRLHFVLSG
jgi:hypothetical protein